MAETSKKADAQPDRRGPRKAPHALMVAGLIFWALVPTIGFAYLTWSERQIAIEPTRVVWTPIATSDEPVRREINISVTRSEIDRVFAPNWSGLVQEVPVSVGSTISHGQVVAVVDGISRLAMATSRPFARPLSSGDEGSDVAQLNAVLDERGLEAGTDDDFDRSTLRGVQAIAHQLGVPDADSLITFDPAWFVFLPVHEMHISSSTLKVGAPAPALGEVAFEGDRRITGAFLVASSESGPPIGTSEDSNDDDAQAESAPPSPTEKIQAAPNQQLIVGSQILPLSETRDEVDAGALAMLAGLIEPDASSVRGSLESEPLAGQWTLPTAAVFTDEDGSLCAVVKRKTSISIREVSVVGIGSGVTVVEGKLQNGDRVLVSPHGKERKPCG